MCVNITRVIVYGNIIFSTLILTFSGLESSTTREVMSDANALGMRAETNSRKCLSPASSSSSLAHVRIPEAMLKKEETHFQIYTELLYLV